MSHVIRLILLAAAIYSNVIFASSHNLQEKTNILFIGNSYTGANYLPSVIQQIAKANGKQLSFSAEIKNGTPRYQHWQLGNAQQLILSKKWHYVVLQDASGSALEHPEKTLQYGKLFVDLIKQQGATPLLFNTWAYKGIPNWVTELQDESLKSKFIQFIPHMADKTNALYQQLSEVSGATVVKVGQHWQALSQISADIQLHSADKSHPSPTGTYFTAMLFYQSIYGEAPSSLPDSIKTHYNQTKMDQILTINIQRNLADLMLNAMAKQV